MSFKPRDKIDIVYKIGDVVYFHAYARKDKSTILLCKGIISRLPIKTSPIYKVIITSICKTAVGTDEVEKIASDMIGMTIPCLSKNMFRGTTDIMALTYNLEKWIDINIERLRTILHTINSRKEL